MSNAPGHLDDDDDIPEILDFSNAEDGKYYERYKAGHSRAMPIDSDLAAIFHDSAKINKALRIYLAEHGAPPELEEKPVVAK
jgi:hypothetical protein